MSLKPTTKASLRKAKEYREFYPKGKAVNQRKQAASRLKNLRKAGGSVPHTFRYTYPGGANH